MDQEIIVSGLGDNLLLICAKDGCGWTETYPMAEPLDNLIKDATKHLNESHKD